jgi:hypothetical protein
VSFVIDECHAGNRPRRSDAEARQFVDEMDWQVRRGRTRQSRRRRRLTRQSRVRNSTQTRPPPSLLTTRRSATRTAHPNSRGEPMSSPCPHPANWASHGGRQRADRGPRTAPYLPILRPDVQCRGSVGQRPLAAGNRCASRPTYRAFRGGGRDRSEFDEVHVRFRTCGYVSRRRPAAAYDPRLWEPPTRYSCSRPSRPNISPSRAPGHRR